MEDTMHTRPLSMLSLLVSVLLGLPAGISAQVVCKTTVPAGLVVNTTWTKANSPYCVIGDIQVSLLTIEPGVEVYLDPGVNISVLSTITAVGTRAEPILFTARNQDPLERWGHIEFTDTQPGSEFAHCVFEYAGDSAMVIVNSSPVIRDSCFRNNTSPSDGGALKVDLSTGDLFINTCVIEDNTCALDGGGIRAITGTGTLTLDDCELRRNTATGGSGVSRRGGGIKVIGTSTITDCLFEQNSVFASSGLFQTRDTEGGGVWTEGDCTIRRSSFLENLCHTTSGGDTRRSWGGGIFQLSGSLKAYNSIIACNTLLASQLRRGAGIMIWTGDALIENTTIARNNIQGVDVNADNTIVINSILWDNNGGAGTAQIAGTPTVTYSCVQGGYTGMGNIAFNPVFAGSACCEADLKIVIGSLCIDAGDPNPIYDDACFPPSHGTSRNDMGAHGGPGACPEPPDNAKAKAFGENCSGLQSNPILTPVTFPKIGTTFTVELSGLNPTQPAAVGIIGFSRQCFGGQQLPIDLEFLSMTGCKLLVAFDRTKLINSNMGSAIWNLNMPSGPAATGIEFFLQGVSVDPGSNFIGLTMSNALDCRVGL